MIVFRPRVTDGDQNGWHIDAHPSEAEELRAFLNTRIRRQVHLEGLDSSLPILFVSKETIDGAAISKEQLQQLVDEFASKRRYASEFSTPDREIEVEYKKLGDAKK